MSALISIITPVYNVEQFIVETIESVLKQTYSNWELLLVDDGSTDGSTKICKEYSSKDDRIKYFYKKNGGQASARNLGIKNSNGQYITFLDSDDLYVEDKLENHFIDLKNCPADFYYGAGYMLYENRVKNKVEEYHWISGENSGEDFFKILYHSCAVNINSVFVKKTLFDEVGLFDESTVLRGTEDWDLWLRIALQVKNVYGNPKPRVYYRIHDNGIHLQRANMLIGKWNIYEKHEDNSWVFPLVRKREYRYVFRELMNALQKEGRTNEVRALFYKFSKKDKFSFVTMSQQLLIRGLPLNVFLWLSNKIVYRIGYRLESLTYNIFLNE